MRRILRRNDREIVGMRRIERLSDDIDIDWPRKLKINHGAAAEIKADIETPENQRQDPGNNYQQRKRKKDKTFAYQIQHS